MKLTKQQENDLAETVRSVIESGEIDGYTMNLGKMFKLEFKLENRSWKDVNTGEIREKEGVRIYTTKRNKLRQMLK